MPRYYFHILTGGTLTKDAEGIEFADLAEAIEDAVRSADNFVRETGQFPSPDIVIQIADEFGATLSTVPLPRIPSIKT